jgi:hypothetical protein
MIKGLLLRSLLLILVPYVRSVICIRLDLDAANGLRQTFRTERRIQLEQPAKMYLETV